MVTVDIATLSFLLGTFTTTIEQFGESKKSVEFFLNQVAAQVNIGYISNKEVLIIKELLACENTTNLKWDSVKRDIKQFTDAMNIICSRYNTDDDIVRCVQLLKQKGKISTRVESVLKRIYNIEDSRLKTIDISEAKDNKFQNMYKNGMSPIIGSIKIQEASIRQDAKDKLTLETTRIIRVIKYGVARDYYIEIKNTEAVCSSDPSRYVEQLQDFIEYDHIIECLSKTTEYKVGIKKKTGDVCHPTISVEDVEEVHQIMREIDWKKVYSNLEEVRKDIDKRLFKS